MSEKEELLSKYDQCLNSIHECFVGSESDYESKIIYIAAGAIAVSTALPLARNYLIIGSWWLLGFSLIINIISANIIKKKCSTLSSEINQAKNELEGNFTPFDRYNSIVRKIKKTNFWSDIFNKATSILFVSGIVLLLVCVTIYLNC